MHKLNPYLLTPTFKTILAVALALPLLELSIAPAAAQGLEFWNRDCQNAYKKWKSNSPHKAFAVSNSSAGGGNAQACGYSWSAATKSSAESSAIAACQKNTYAGGRCYVTKSE